MTDRKEIERLLSQTGRTLGDLPNGYSVQEVDHRFKEIVGEWRFGDFVLHQSDVIELLIGALRDALDKQPKWISVEERLPEPFVGVLVQMPDESPHPTVKEGFILNSGIWIVGYYRCDPDEITHWRNMPEPPKEDK